MDMVLGGNSHERAEGHDYAGQVGQKARPYETEVRSEGLAVDVVDRVYQTHETPHIEVDYNDNKYQISL